MASLHDIKAWVSLNLLNLNKTNTKIAVFGTVNLVTSGPISTVDIKELGYACDSDCTCDKLT